MLTILYENQQMKEKKNHINKMHIEIKTTLRLMYDE